MYTITTDYTGARGASDYVRLEADLIPRHAAGRVNHVGAQVRGCTVLVLARDEELLLETAFELRAALSASTLVLTASDCTSAHRFIDAGGVDVVLCSAISDFALSLYLLDEKSPIPLIRSGATMLVLRKSERVASWMHDPANAKHLSRAVERLNR